MDLDTLNRAHPQSSPTADDATTRCVVCRRQLITIRFALNGHQAELRSCGPCNRQAMLIDGSPVTKDDLVGTDAAARWGAAPHRRTLAATAGDV